MVTLETVRKRLDELTQKQKEWELAHPEEAKLMKLCEICGQAPCECELRERAFWGGQDTAEDVEQRMVEGHPFESILPFDDETMWSRLTAAQQEKVDDWKSDECEKNL